MVSETKRESEYLRSAVRKSSVLLTVLLSASTHISLNAFLHFEFGIWRLEKPTQLNADLKFYSDKYAWQIKIIMANIKNWVSFLSMLEKPPFFVYLDFFLKVAVERKIRKYFELEYLPRKDQQKRPRITLKIVR